MYQLVETRLKTGFFKGFVKETHFLLFHHLQIDIENFLVNSEFVSFAPIKWHFTGIFVKNETLTYIHPHQFDFGVQM